MLTSAEFVRSYSRPGIPELVWLESVDTGLSLLLASHRSQYSSHNQGSLVAKETYESVPQRRESYEKNYSDYSASTSGLDALSTVARWRNWNDNLRCSRF